VPITVFHDSELKNFVINARPKRPDAPVIMTVDFSISKENLKNFRVLKEIYFGF